MMSKELYEKLKEETKQINEILKNSNFNDKDIINKDNEKHIQKWIWNSIKFLESEKKDKKTELYKQLVRLDRKNKQLTWSEVKVICRKVNDKIEDMQKNYDNLYKAIPIAVGKKDKSYFKKFNEN